MPQELADIDLKSIRFPSDSVTVFTLRSLYPEKIDVRDAKFVRVLGNGLPGSESTAYDRLAEMIHLERELAKFTYDKKMNRETDPYGPNAKEFREDLGRIYAHFGLASGPAVAKQLVRSIEDQVMEQVRQHGGKPAGGRGHGT